MSTRDDEKNITPHTSNKHQIQQFLDDIKKLPTKSSYQQGRLVFAIDATASRQATWDTACHIQAEMFTQTQALGGIMAQLCYYRGFSDFYASDWMSQANALRKQMLGVQCLGGHTQIGKLMKHVINESKKNKINAAIFIGDAVEESADDLCNFAGQLGLLNVPLFMFQEGADINTERVFKQIAKLSNGAYCHFDQRSAQALADLLGAVAVYATGGKAALLRHQHKAPQAVALLQNQLTNKGSNQ